MSVAPEIRLLSSVCRPSVSEGIGAQAAFLPDGAKGLRVISIDEDYRFIESIDLIYSGNSMTIMA
jgi:hypothetical protein